MKHDLFSLKSQLYDSRAISENLPHEDLTKLIPFKSDEDVITCLDNANLNNALFSKVINPIRLNDVLTCSFYIYIYIL